MLVYWGRGRGVEYEISANFSSTQSYSVSRYIRYTYCVQFEGLSSFYNCVVAPY